MSRKRTSGDRLGLILAVYLVGLLIGGLYVGMVSPARTVVQADFGIDGTVGIWMINIYTLFYAALIPVIGKTGPKPVIITGLAISILGLLFLSFVAVAAPSFATFVAGLAVVGAGMGMAMGAPTNYMILENTDKEDSTSAIATITLIRQIGTTIAPAVFVGLIASAPGLAGYQNMLLCVALFNALALITMLFYRSPRR